MNYYNQQGPAQYAQHQQSRKDRQTSQLLQMMMQMKQFKEGQKQFEVEQETARDKQDWLEKYQQGTLDYYRFQANPEMQRRIAESKAKGKRLGEGEQPEPPRPILPSNMIPWMKKRYGPHAVKNWEKTDDTTRRQIINQWELETKPEKPARSTEKQQFERDHLRLSNLIKRYDKAAQDTNAILKGIPTAVEITGDMSDLEQRKQTKRNQINDLKAQEEIAKLQRIRSATQKLISLQDRAANGEAMTDEETRLYKTLMNIPKVRSGILKEDVPDGTPTASNKSGKQVAFLGNKWTPILA
jgi:hypothetical protein